MSTAALVNARNSGGSTTVQTAQLHQQQPSHQAFSRASLGLSSGNKKKSEDIVMSDNVKNGTNASRPPSVQTTDEKRGPEGEQEHKATPVNAPTNPSTASKAKDEGNKMYPDDLRNILVEVSKAGTCSSLSWMEVSEQTAAAAAPAAGAESEARRLPQSPAGGPPRKKQRNGLHHSTNRTGVKRPLSSRAGGHHLSPAHSSRTSGSEMEDMSQYDSEGTVSSEFSMDRARAQHLLNGVINGLNNQKQNASANKAAEAALCPPAKYRSLRQVFRLATGGVLDHFFHKRGGYKLSPAERRRYSIVALSNQKEGEKVAADVPETSNEPQAAEEVFKQRKQRLLNLLGESSDGKQDVTRISSAHSSGPPFTVQRIAEVLLTPERYYTQTHKLCNCLEKLLLVTSSIQAFGGSTGGNSSQTRREEQEIAALADERGRLLSEYRRRRLHRTTEGDILAEFPDRKEAATSPPKASSPEGKMGMSEARGKEECGGVDASKDDLEKEDLLEAARASLRSKFDHVGIDPHSAVANANREHQIGNRSMTNSPPPPNYSAAGIGLAGHAHGGLLRAHHDQEHQHQGSPNSLVVRTTSPIMFKTTPDGASSPKKASPTPVHPTHQNLQLLQMHHAAVLAGVSPFELMALNGSGHSTPATSAPAVGTLSVGGAMMPGLKEMDVECRSSASSDVDSESDDVSFDDSASDRSDGSDSNEPATNSAVARALALNRVQQQQSQQQPQRRVLGSTSTSAFSSGMGQRTQTQSQMQASETPSAAAPVGVRLNEAEYQSGDSIDSLRADDSDSSSDLAD